jgi:predicted transcriptional regulator
MAEQSIFIKTFGDYPLIRVLDFLIYSRDFDYPITEIAQNSDVNFQTLKKIWPQLEKNNFIIKTRKIGNAELYKINEANEIIKKLIELNKFICLQESENMKSNKKKILVNV